MVSPLLVFFVLGFRFFFWAYFNFGVHPSALHLVKTSSFLKYLLIYRWKPMVVELYLRLCDRKPDIGLFLESNKEENVVAFCDPTIQCSNLKALAESFALLLSSLTSTEQNWAYWRSRFPLFVLSGSPNFFEEGIRINWWKAVSMWTGELIVCTSSVISFILSSISDAPTLQGCIHSFPLFSFFFVILFLFKLYSMGSFLPSVWRSSLWICFFWLPNLIK